MSVAPNPYSLYGSALRSWSVRNTTFADLPSIAVLSKEVYPWDPYTIEQLQAQLRVFPQGQFVAVNRSGDVLGMSASMVVPNSRCGSSHTWGGVTGDGLLQPHSLNSADVLYGVETLVHPDARRSGIAQELMQMRFELARRLGVSKHVAAVRLSGYGAYSNVLSPQDYLRHVLNGSILEGCLVMLKNLGYRATGLLPDYLPSDPYSLGHAVRVERRS